MISAFGTTSISTCIEVSEQLAPKVLIVTLNIVGTSTTSVIVPTISYSSNDPLADIDKAKPAGNGVVGSLTSPAALLNLKVAKVSGAGKDAPVHTGFRLSTVLSALPLVNSIVAASSISIIPVAVATAQPATGACVVTV